MFIYVFSEAARRKMEAAGFVFVCRDTGANAWVFLADQSGRHAVPDGIEKVVTSRMTFDGKQEIKDKRRGRSAWDRK